MRRTQTLALNMEEGGHVQEAASGGWEQHPDDSQQGSGGLSSTTTRKWVLPTEMIKQTNSPLGLPEKIAALPMPSFNLERLGPSLSPGQDPEAGTGYKNIHLEKKYIRR